MAEEVVLGVRGDLNQLKKRMMENAACNTKVRFAPATNKDGIHTVLFESKGDGTALDSFMQSLAEYIIERYEAPLIRRILCEKYPQLTPAQTREILRNTEYFTDDRTCGYRARKKAVLLSLYNYLAEDSEMFIDGFVSFRLKDYEALLESLAEKLVENCITRHEYEDFISLLRYFVSIQENRPSIVHVCVTADGRYELFSESLEDITDECLSDFVDPLDIPESANFDDLLISMLITLAPKHITVHHAEQIRNRELFRTIRRVFSGSLSYCTGCDMCSNKMLSHSTQNEV